jgi:hypothetical protein
MATTFDTLKFVEKLENGGFTHAQAKAAAEAFAEATSQELATKTDITRVETTIQLLEHRMTIKLGGLIIAATGIILAALRYLPPGH